MSKTIMPRVIEMKQMGWKQTTRSNVADIDYMEISFFLIIARKNIRTWKIVKRRPNVLYIFIRIES